MRVLLIAIGSTGDVQPMIVLGKALRARGHTVSLAAFAALEASIRDAGLLPITLPGDAHAYIGQLIRPGANPVTYLSRMRQTIIADAEAIIDVLDGAFRDADIAVTTFFGSTVYAVAEKHGVPLVQTNLCLTDVNGNHCLPVMRQPPLGPAFNRATYRVAYAMIGAAERRYAAPVCESRGMTPRLTSGGMRYEVGGRPVPVLYALSEQVVPRPPEWPENIECTGFWVDEPCAHTPSRALADFLRQGPPLYIGFGSMNAGDMQSAMRLVVQAVRASGQRAVIAAGWSGLEDVAGDDDVFFLKELVPHRWLFERVAGVVHHGGAGTTAAGFLAGRPALVVPFGSDQFFWGDRVHALGCGPPPQPRVSLRADRLADGLRALVREEGYAQNAAQLQARLQVEHGQQVAAARIEQAAQGHI